MFRPTLDPVGGSLFLSALAAAVPLVLLFVLLGGLRMKAWLAGVLSLVAAVVVATTLFNMPVGQALLSGTEGAAFGFFPIMWIVLNAIWVYNLTVATGHFDVLRRSFERISADQRVQAIIIAFCFGALLEALAGFGTPVAITVVMLMSLGFKPVKAATVALLANTAPVAFGALATPVVTLGAVASGVSSDPRLTVDNLGAMIGRQTPILAVVVPLFLVIAVDGRRGARQTWPAALTAGLAFGLAQFVAANYISVQLADIIASLVATLAVVALTRVWQPSQLLTPQTETVGAAGAGAAAVGERAPAPTPVGAGAGMGRMASSAGMPTATGGTGAVGGEGRVSDSGSEVTKAYLPYLVIIALFSVTNIPAIKDGLGAAPWSYSFSWPGLDVLTLGGKPSSTMIFKLNWLGAAGTLMIIAGLITAVILRIGLAQMWQTYRRTYYELRWAILTVMAVLALAYVMNLSGQTSSLGAWLAGAGAAFAILSPVLGWIGVGVTGSDTSANALFGALQVQTATKAGLDPLLMASANSSGGVMGKMISPQNLAIAAAAVGMAGREGEIFRKVIGWSLLLLVLVCILVGLQSTPVLSWMVP